jgi:hypothetical protein
MTTIPRRVLSNDERAIRKQRAVKLCQEGDAWKKFRCLSTMSDPPVEFFPVSCTKGDRGDCIVIRFEKTMIDDEGQIEDAISGKRYTKIGDVEIFDDEVLMICNYNSFFGNMYSATWSINYELVDNLSGKELQADEPIIVTGAER